MPGMGGGGGGWGNIITDVADAAGALAGGSGPHANPYRANRGRINKYGNLAWRDEKAYRRGGIDDPRLAHLDMPVGQMVSKIRDDTQGGEYGNEQRLAGIYRGYGGPSDKSPQYVENLMRLRAGRENALTAARRDLEIWNRQSKYDRLMAEMTMGQNQQLALGGQFNQAEAMAYQAALNRFRQRKGDYQQVAGDIGDAVSSYISGMGSGGSGGGGGGGMDIGSLIGSFSGGGGGGGGA